MRSALILTLSTLSLAIGGRAQDDLQPASPEVLQAFDLTNGTVQRLTLPAATEQGLEVGVTLNGVGRTLTLKPCDIRGANFQLLVDDGKAIREVPAPAVALYRGTIAGHDDSIVAAQVDNGRLHATLRFEGITWGIEALREHLPTAAADAHVVYRRADVWMPADLRCAVPDGLGRGHDHGLEPGNQLQMVTLKQTDIALDLDENYFARNGSNVGTAMAAAFRTMNDVDVIYQRDVGITYKIGTVLVRQVPTYANSDLQALLPEFQNRWNSQHGNIQRDVVHLFTGKGSFSGIIGIAYLSVICNIGSAYGISKAYSNAVTNAGLVAHELGHNWAAPHCDGSSPCNIMCSGLGGCSGNLTAFAPVSINVITNFRNSRGCLSNRESGAAGSYTSGPPVVTCIGTAGLAQHTAFGQARIGMTGYYRLSGAPANANTFLIFGLSNTVWNGINLPVDLGIIGAAGCPASIDHLIVLPGLAGASGNRQVSYVYPNVAAFVGRLLFSQYFIVDPGANALGLVTTNNFRTTLGA